jgi:hypothetical protein
MGYGYHGRRTASGERFNTYALTAAHRTRRFCSHVTVTNKANGRSVRVRITDRGPFIKGAASICLDCSQRNRHGRNRAQPCSSSRRQRGKEVLQIALNTTLYQHLIYLNVIPVMRSCKEEEKQPQPRVDGNFWLLAECSL